MLSSKVWLVAAIAAAGLVSGAASAQANLKIGVVSMARLVEQSPQFDAARKKLDDEFSPRQRDLQAMEQRLRSETERFQRDAPVMAEAERVNLERQIRDGQREFERTRNELVEDFNLRQNEELGQIQRDVIARARAYASEQKFDLLLFGDQSVVFASTAVDVTAAVLAALQASAPAAAPAPAPARGQ